MQEGKVENKSDKKSASGGSVKELMNGVSHMIPFVVVGGLFIALAIAIGGNPTASGMVIPQGSIWNKVSAIGGIG
ncbi:PTS fructose transporter subunit IIC, partial [Casaltella massiliensis]|nr:PTS fructose transporter subunit IIC [Casaltella massiliensis]